MNLLRLPLALLAFASPLLAQTSPMERRIVQEVDARADEGIALLEQVVNVNSGTMNLPGVREVGRILREEFVDARVPEPLGMASERLPGRCMRSVGGLEHTPSLVRLPAYRTDIRYAIGRYYSSTP